MDLIATKNPQNTSKLNRKRAPSHTTTWFCENLKGVNLGLCPQGGLVDANELWRAFEEGFMSIVDKHAINNSPFLNNDIRHAMHKHYCFLKQSKKNWFHQNHTINMIRRAKEPYNRHIIEKNGNDGKAFWKTAKKVLPGESMNLSLAIKIGDNVCHNKQYTVNMFNRFFCQCRQSPL